MSRVGCLTGQTTKLRAWGGARHDTDDRHPNRRTHGSGLERPLPLTGVPHLRAESPFYRQVVERQDSLVDRAGDGSRMHVPSYGSMNRGVVVAAVTLLAALTLLDSIAVGRPGRDCHHRLGRGRRGPGRVALGGLRGLHEHLFGLSSSRWRRDRRHLSATRRQPECDRHRLPGGDHSERQARRVGRQRCRPTTA